MCRKRDPSEATSDRVSQVGRRGVVALACSSIFGLGLAALVSALGLGSAAMARFFWPNALREPPSRFRAGSLGDYPPDHVETRFADQHGAWIVHGEWEGQRRIFALSTACTHLGCITLWLPDQRRFQCPCHGSGFHDDGLNSGGPASRPLVRLAIRLADDGQLEVDTSRTFRAELGQWNDPACYVLT